MKLCPDVVCQTAAGGPTGAATENMHGGMAQGTVEEEKRLGTNPALKKAVEYTRNICQNVR